MTIYHPVNEYPYRDPGPEPDPDGPLGEAGARLRALVARLEGYYDFQCEGGPLRNCVEWQTLKAELYAISGQQRCGDCGCRRDEHPNDKDCAASKGFDGCGCAAFQDERLSHQETRGAVAAWKQQYRALQDWVEMYYGHDLVALGCPCDGDQKCPLHDDLGQLPSVVTQEGEEPCP